MYAHWLQVSDTNTVIPRNSVIEANQSGLIAEPLLDVTPQVGPATCCMAFPLVPCASLSVRDGSFMHFESFTNLILSNHLPYCKTPICRFLRPSQNRPSDAKKHFAPFCTFDWPHIDSLVLIIVF